jgi:hypothetical protein
LRGVALGGKFLRFSARFGDYRDEATLVPVDGGHVLGGAQLRIRDVEEICTPQHASQRQPRFNVQRVIRSIPIVGLEVNRDGAVSCNR